MKFPNYSSTNVSYVWNDVASGSYTADKDVQCIVRGSMSTSGTYLVLNVKQAGQTSGYDFAIGPGTSYSLFLKKGGILTIGYNYGNQLISLYTIPLN